MKKWEAFVTMGAEKTSERGDDMTALEFIHKHQNDEDNGECLILPDGSVEEPLPSHIGRLVELTGMDAGALHGRMEKKYGAAVLAGGIHRLHVRVADAGSSADSADGAAAGCA